MNKSTTQSVMLIKKKKKKLFFYSKLLLFLSVKMVMMTNCQARKSKAIPKKILIKDKMAISQAPLLTNSQNVMQI